MIPTVVEWVLRVLRVCYTKDYPTRVAVSEASQTDDFAGKILDLN